MSQEKPQGQEVEVQNESQNDEEDAKPLKSSISKTQSLDTPSIESLDDKEKSGFSIQRSKTLPGRLKTSQLELEDRTGICNSLSFGESTVHVTARCQPGAIYVGVVPHWLQCCVLISESCSGFWPDGHPGILWTVIFY